MSENVSKQIRSEVTKEGKLLIYVESTAMPEPKECLRWPSPRAI